MFDPARGARGLNIQTMIGPLSCTWHRLDKNSAPVSYAAASLFGELQVGVRPIFFAGDFRLARIYKPCQPINVVVLKLHTQWMSGGSCTPARAGKLDAAKTRHSAMR